MSTTKFNNDLLDLHPNLERFAHSLTANSDNANDLLQETYLKALTYRHTFQENTNIKAWVFTIMRNIFINNYRKVRRQRNTVVLINQQIFEEQNSYENPESRVSHNEICRKVEALDDEFKIPFQLHTNGYKYKEIAERINLKLGTVKSRIFFSRQKLMNELHDYQ